MKKIWKPTLFFVFCLILFLAINLPVSLVLKQVTLPPNIKLAGVDGKITSGHVAAVYANNFPVRELHYEADLSCLLALTVCYRIDYQNGKADISFNPLTNDLVIEQIDVDYSMAELAPLMDQLLVKPTGELNLKINQMSIKQNKLSHLDGLAIWSNAGVVGEDINLGDYQLDVEREADSYRFKLTDRQAMLDIDGSGRLKSTGSYLIDIKIQADSSLDDNIKSILALAAQKKGLNDYVIQRQGQLPPQFTRQLIFSDDL